MRFTRADLDAAVAAGVLDVTKLPELTAFLETRQTSDGVVKRRFDLANLLWYAGALIVMTSMGLFSTLAFSAMGGTALTVTALVYALVFVLAGHYLWYRKELHTPGGLLIAAAVSMAPLAVYGIQSQYSFWGHYGSPGSYRDFFEWANNSWVYMEIMTVAVSLIALWFYPFPFIVAITAVGLWFMSMDLGAWCWGANGFASSDAWATDQSISMVFGLCVLLAAWIVDQRIYRNGDFAFWLHIFGLISFLGALTFSSYSGETAQALFCLLNVGLVFLSLYLMRQVYAVFGTIGIAGYLGHLADSVFSNSILFPFALSLVGLGVIGMGLVYYRLQRRITGALIGHLPRVLLNLRPARARLA